MEVPKLNDLEKKEKHIEEPDMTVLFLRHGKPTYTNEEYLSSEFEGKLDESAKIKVREQAEKLADNVKDDELVYFWVSPKQRAQETAAILKEVFDERGVAMLKQGEDFKTVKTISDVRNPSRFWDEWYDKTNGKLEAGFDPGRWMERWVDLEKQDDLAGQGETPAQVKKRTIRMIAYLSRIAKQIHPIDESTGSRKKIKLIVVAHEETIRDVLEQVFHRGTRKGTGPAYAEVIEMGIHNPKKETDSPTIDVKFGDEIGSFKFDSKKREMQ